MGDEDEGAVAGRSPLARGCRECCDADEVAGACSTSDSSSKDTVPSSAEEAVSAASGRRALRRMSTEQSRALVRLTADPAVRAWSPRADEASEVTPTVPRGRRPGWRPSPRCFPHSIFSCLAGAGGCSARIATVEPTSANHVVRGRANAWENTEDRQSHPRTAASDFRAPQVTGTWPIERRDAQSELHCVGKGAGC